MACKRHRRQGNKTCIVLGIIISSILVFVVWAILSERAEGYRLAPLWCGRRLLNNGSCDFNMLDEHQRRTAYTSASIGLKSEHTKLTASVSELIDSIRTVYKSIGSNVETLSITSALEVHQLIGDVDVNIRPLKNVLVGVQRAIDSPRFQSDLAFSVHDTHKEALLLQEYVTAATTDLNKAIDIIGRYVRAPVYSVVSEMGSYVSI